MDIFLQKEKMAYHDIAPGYPFQKCWENTLIAVGKVKQWKMVQSFVSYDVLYDFLVCLYPTKHC